jgi:hypothetical protein
MAEKYIEPTSFTIKSQTMGLDISSSLEGRVLKDEFRLMIQGHVVFGDPLIMDASVDAHFWAGEDERVREIQGRGSLGSVIISKDVADIKDISIDSSRPLAGLMVTVPMLEEQFLKLRDNLALCNSSCLTINFGCTSDKLIRETPEASRKLLWENEDVTLTICGYGFNFSL